MGCTACNCSTTSAIRRQGALYEIESMRYFAGLRLSDRLPDQSTTLRFRY
ncbi:transposase [Spongiibacter thalassae]